MRNQLAIAGAIAALMLTTLALGATIYAFWPTTTSEPVSVSFQALDPSVRATEAVETGQSKPRVPDTVGPEMPEKSVADPDSPKPEKAKARKQANWKPSVLQVVTNFEEADVKVNGLAYPEYYEPGEPEGMVLPAGGPYNVEVKFGSNTKVYNLYLRPHETRLLLVELSGYNSGPPSPPKKAEPAKKDKKKKKTKKDKKDEDGKIGKITVYSKPPGTVLVDGSETGEKTPGSVELDNGRHEVQVKYESGTVSEKKIVRVRTGSRIKLFFRERKGKK